MASYNKVLLMGNLTRDPQLSYTPSQTAVVDFGIATNRRWTGPDGSQRDETCFVDCRAFGKQAETLNKYLSKGRPVFVEGRLTYDSWTAQDGSKKSRLRVTVESFQFMPSGQGGGQGGGQGQHQGQGGQGQYENRGYGAPEQTYPAPSSEAMPHDDIPF